MRLLHEPGDPVATVVLDRPATRNAQTPATWRALAAIGARLLTDPDVRVVVLRAEGPSFSAGLDRAMFAGGVPGEPGLAELAVLDEPALDAAIDGFQLALACDLRLVADDVAFSMKETSLGLVPDLGGTTPLVALVGYSRALEVCATGRRVGAQEAVAWGLASLAIPLEQLASATDDLVAALLAAPAEALRATKGLLAQAGSQSYDEQRASERAAQAGRLRALAQGA